MKIDKVGIRRRNLVPASAMPYMTPVALQYDSGNFPAMLEAGLRAADYAGFARRREASAKNGKLRGIGLSTYIEACGIAPSAVAGALGARAGLYEAAEVRLHPTGTVTVFTGSHAHGQSHETTFAQVVSDKLGVPFENIEIVHGDTDRIPFGMGTYGSRSIAVGGVAIVNACDKVITKGKKIAAHVLQTSADKVDFEAGVFKDKASNKTMSLGEVALTAYVPHNFPHDTLEPGLDEQAFYDPKNFTYPNGCYICEVEIDQETGDVEVASFSAVDDFGNVINPMVVEGQVHGGLVQGIGQALLERCVYDAASGQILSGTYMDYAMPRADDVPSFGVSTNGVPCTHNVLGVKGCGEAGAIGAPAAVMNAVVDALAPLGIDHVEMPATAQTVWRALKSARKMAAD
jgi:carbon-monoxide dehydrogenase large subunit